LNRWNPNSPAVHYRVVVEGGALCRLALSGAAIHSDLVAGTIPLTRVFLAGATFVLDTRLPISKAKALKGPNMSMFIDKRAWVPQLLGIFALALGWALPAHAETCNAVRWGDQSLSMHWDDKTIAGCLAEAQEFTSKMDKDPVEAAFQAMDDVCAQLEANQLSGDMLATAEKVCARLRTGIKKEPAH
jgi:hypothetical protein